jgi:dTDP-4-amino-4,6-dideoxygalactose transaminase
MSAAAVNVPLLDLKAQYATIREEVREVVDAVLESQYFILGPEVEGLEREVAEYCQCKFAYGLSSGSDALIVALMAIDIQPGDEVILPTYTFFATAGAVWRLGAKPVFVDCDPVSFNLVPAEVELAITAKTKAIIPVHLYGRMAEMDAVLEIAKLHNLKVIEDAAQAIGSETAGRRAGCLGDMACFSFFPSKNLGGIGDGGMITTNDPVLADKVVLLRNHGYRPKYYNKVVGGNFRLDAIQAAVLRVKLRYLDQWTAGRRHNATRYQELFQQHELLGKPNNPLGQFAIELAADDAGGRHVYNQFIIRVPQAQRDAARSYLAEQQVGTEIYYPVPLHLQECFAALNHTMGDFPQSELAASQTIALPIYPELTEAQLRWVAQSLQNFATSSSQRSQAA